MSKQICVVEDDESIRALLVAVLSAEGYRVADFASAESALAALPALAPQLVLLDIMLEGMDGVTALRLLRRNPAFAATKVLLLTAKDTETDKIAGLDAGADDYITKPFSVLELSARVRAALRSAEPIPQDDARFGALYINFKTREVTMSGAPVDLTYKEFELLRMLMEHADRVLLREELLRSVWGYEYIGETRTLDMHIGTLRQKLGDTAAAPQYIRTVRGVGYRFIARAD
ncbi:MAG: response regulator transcription factor [Pygmaiobacter sp.]